MILRSAALAPSRFTRCLYTRSNREASKLTPTKPMAPLVWALVKMYPHGSRKYSLVRFATCSDFRVQAELSFMYIVVVVVVTMVAAVPRGCKRDPFVVLYR